MDMNAKRERHRRFWQPLEKGEGGYLAVSAPIDDSGIAPCPLDPPSSLEEQWLSVEYALKRAEADSKNRYWGLDAIHNVFPNFGPGVQAAMLGAPYALQKESVWFDMDPPIKNWDTMPDLTTNREHELYKAVEAHTRALCAASKGRYTVAYTDIGGQMDVLCSLRGENLLMDLIEYPDEVLAAQEKLDQEFVSYFNTLTDIIGPSGCGYTGWIPIASDHPWFPVQCDMSVMISQNMFETFVLPSLDKVTTQIGNSIYHLDGPGEIQHLDMLLSLKHIHAIQWVPLPTATAADGSMYRDFTDPMSLDVYRRTLQAGRKVVLTGIMPFQVPIVFDAVGCDGVFIETYCDTRKEADELVAFAQSNSWVKY
ncbi:MAG: hypothetical protein FWD03_02380 [Defluviitaleaceae bacterium]|nr:hypothetical protein [Defluviitaleaceae bacterium]